MSKEVRSGSESVRPPSAPEFLHQLKTNLMARENGNPRLPQEQRQKADSALKNINETGLPGNQDIFDRDKNEIKRRQLDRAIEAAKNYDRAVRPKKWHERSDKYNKRLEEAKDSLRGGYTSLFSEYGSHTDAVLASYTSSEAQRTRKDTLARQEVARRNIDGRYALIMDNLTTGKEPRLQSDRNILEDFNRNFQHYMEAKKKGQLADPQGVIRRDTWWHTIVQNYIGTHHTFNRDRTTVSFSQRLDTLVQAYENRHSRVTETVTRTQAPNPRINERPKLTPVSAARLEAAPKAEQTATTINTKTFMDALAANPNFLAALQKASVNGPENFFNPATLSLGQSRTIRVESSPGQMVQVTVGRSETDAKVSKISFADINAPGQPVVVFERQAITGKRRLFSRSKPEYTETGYAILPTAPGGRYAKHHEPGRVNETSRSILGKIPTPLRAA